MTPRPFLVPPCAAFLLAALLAAPVLAQKGAPATNVPQSTALLGVAAPRLPAGGGVAGFASSSLQGDGTLGNPYIKVQIPGFDKDAPAAISPWRSGRNGPPIFTLCPQEPVQFVTTGRRHARMSPLYRDPVSGQCSPALNCTPGLQLEPVELHQGFIDAGSCAYGSIAFDTRISPNGDDAVVCAGRNYLRIEVDEHHPLTGMQIGSHAFVIDRTMYVAFGLHTWQRLTFHFALHAPGSLLRLRFRLTPARCVTGPWAYPGTVDLDNVALDTIPDVDLGPGGVITSGCQSGVPGCGGLTPLFGNPLLVGLPCTFAQHDAFAPVLCPQSHCNADLNFDGIVDSQDLTILLSDWGTLPTNVCQRRYADLDGDQQVGSSDLAILLSAWGPCP
jgi:hypothetical protein